MIFPREIEGADISVCVLFGGASISTWNMMQLEWNVKDGRDPRTVWKGRKKWHTNTLFFTSSCVRKPSIKSAKIIHWEEICLQGSQSALPDSTTVPGREFLLILSTIRYILLPKPYTHPTKQRNSLTAELTLFILALYCRISFVLQAEFPRHWYLSPWHRWCPARWKICQHLFG